MDELFTTYSCADVEGFMNWFRENKAPVIQQSMLQSITVKCGLGSPPISVTTNACEAANSVLKKKVDYKQNHLLVFITELVDEQYHEMVQNVITAE